MIYKRFYRFVSLLLALLLLLEPVILNFNYAYALETTHTISSTPSRQTSSNDDTTGTPPVLPPTTITTSTVDSSILTSDTATENQQSSPTIEYNHPYSDRANDKDTHLLKSKAPAALSKRVIDESSATTKSIEVITKRTAGSKTFKNPDGSYTLKSYVTPIHYRDKDKKWQDIDNGLISSLTPGFSYENKANDFKIKYGAVSANPINPSVIEVEKNDKHLSLGFNDLRPSEALLNPDYAETNEVAGSRRVKQTKEDEVSYMGVYDGVDVNYKTFADKVKEELILNKYNGKNRFLFSISTTGLTWKKQKNGSIIFRDKKTNKKTFSIPAPYMYDASLKSRNSKPNNLSPFGRVDMDVVLRGTKLYLELSADKKWLADSERVFPVVIDPTVTVYGDNVNYGDTDITTANPNTNHNGEDSVASGDSGAGWYYSLLSFDLSALKKAGIKTEITAATFNVFANFENNHTKPAWINKIDQPWNINTVTWNNQPSSTNLTSINVSSDGWLRYNAQSTVQNWVDGVWPNYGFLIHDGHTYLGQVDYNYFKIWAAAEGSNPANKPYISINYNMYGADYFNDETPKRMAAGQSMQVPVTIINTGTDTWSKGGSNPFRLSYHWYDQSGANVVWDGLRTDLTKDVAPGDQVTLDAKVTAPTGPGSYTLKWDMLKEGAYWFSWKNIATGDYTVNVNAISNSTSGIEGFWSLYGFDVAGLNGSADVKTGNLNLSEADLSIDGRGDSIDISHYYNSKSSRLSTTPGYITNWLVNGPYSNSNSNTRLSNDYLGGEAAIQPVAGTLSSGNFWRPFQSSADKTDLNKIFGGPSYVTSYLHTYIYSPATQSGKLYLGSDDGVKAWLNGTNIWTNDVYRGITPDIDHVPVTLNQGWNRLLIKVSQGIGGWGLYARFVDNSGNNLTDLTYDANPSLFGPGWQADFEENITQFEDNALIYTDADGTAHFFSKNYAGGYTAPPGIYSELTVNAKYDQNADNSVINDYVNWKYRVKETSGERRYFNGAGRLIRIADGKNTGRDATGYSAENDANRKLYNYDNTNNTGGALTSIADASNRHVYITTANNKITALTDWNGRTVEYSYDQNSGSLTKATLKKGAATIPTTYDYETNDPFYIKSVTDANGKTAYLTYDSNNKLSAFRDSRSSGAGDDTYKTSFNYDSSTQTNIIEPNTKTVRYEFNAKGNPTKYVLDPSGVNEWTDYTYNEVNQNTKITDSAGETAYTIDGKGNITSESNQLNANENAVTNASYNLNSAAPANPLTITDADGNTATSINDMAGNLKTDSRPIENGTYIDYDAFKNPITQAALPKTSANLIKNANFELALSSGWSTTSGTNNSSAVTSEKYFGLKSLKVDGSGGLSDRVSNVITIKPSTIYSRSVYVKGKGQIITVQWRSDDTYLGGDLDQKFDTGNSWRRLNYTFSSNASAGKTAIYLRALSGNVAYFDGVQFEEGSVVSPYNLIENGSFENFSGTLADNWTVTKGAVSVDASSYKIGARSNRLSNGNGFGSALQWWDSGAGNWDWNNSKIVTGDFTGDGKDDVAVLYGYAGNQSKLWVFKSNGSSYNWPVQWWDSGPGNWDWNGSKIIAGDFNGDGKSDVAALYDYGNAQSKLWVFKSGGSSFSSPTQWWDSGVGNWDAASSKITGGDFDSDGQGDIAAFYKYGNLQTKAFVFIANAGGTAFNAPATWWDSGAGTWDWDQIKETSGDYTGDGKSDLAVFYNYDNLRTRLYVFTSTGEKFQSAKQWWDSGAGNWDWNSTKQISSDVDNDGKADIGAFYGYANNQTKIWMLTSTGFSFNAPSCWWDSGAGTWDWSRIKVASGNFNGDTSGDLVSFNDLGNIHTKASVFLGLPPATTSGFKQSVNIKPGTDYLINAWVAGEVQTSTSTISFNISDDGGGQKTIRPENAFSGWTRVSGLYKTQANAQTLTLEIKSNSQGAARNVQVDAVQLIENPSVTGVEYDANGNYPTKQTDALGKDNFTNYDEAGNLTDYRDARSSGPSDSSYLTSYLYNERNILTQVTDPRQNKTYYDYDLNGNLKAVRDARSSSSTDDTYMTAYTYDELNNISSITDPKGYTTAYDYDSSGNESAVTQSNGDVISKNYDAADRLTQYLTNGALDYTFAYDAAGNLTRVDNGPNGSAVNWQYTYDKAHRLTNESEYLAPDQLFSYQNTYDKKSNRTKLSAGGQDYNFTYNANNWLTSASDSYGTTSLFWDDRGDKVGQSNSVFNSSFDYDANQRPIVMTNQNNAASLISDYLYTYDPVGNILTEKETVANKTTAYTYDELNRLDTWFNPITNKYTKYNYDEVGNITKVQDANSSGGPWSDTETFSYDAAGRLTNTGYAFNGNGNQVEDSTNHYFYDAANRLTDIIKKSDLLISDDFNDGNYNGWNVQLGAWAVENGELSQSNSYGRRRIWLNSTYNQDNITISAKMKYPDGGGIVSGIIFRQGSGSTGYHAVRLDNRDDTAQIVINDNVYSTPYTIQSNTWYRLKVALNGTNIKFYVNNELVMERDDLPLGGNKIGLKTTLGHTHFDDVKVSNREVASYTYDYKGRRISKYLPTGDVLDNNFSDGNYSGWTPTAGSWAVTNGELTGNAGVGAHATIKYSNANYKDFTYEVKVKPIITGTNYWRAAILFRYKDANNYYLLHSYENGLVLRKIVNGQSTDLGWVGLTIAPNVFHTLKVEVNGSSIKAYYNNQLKLTATDSALASGEVGLDSWGDGYPISVNYDDAKVSTLAGTTYYHYDGNNVIAETDENNNVTARYAYLGGDYKPYSMTKYNEIPDYSTLTYYFQYNARGDVTSFTDQWGTVVARYTYDPWGNPLTITDGSGNDVSNNPAHRANTNPIRYAGYRYDAESGLYYLLARYYDPSTYRFLTKDPDGGDKDSPLTQNLYAYAGDNPVMNVDPDGEFVLTTAAVLLIAGTGVLLYATAVAVNSNNLDTGAIQREIERQAAATAAGVRRAYRRARKYLAEHTAKARPSTKPKHQKGRRRVKKDKGGEKGDKRRRPVRKRPRKWSGPWPILNMWHKLIFW